MKKLLFLLGSFLSFNSVAYWPWVEEICFNPKCPKETPIQFWEASKELEDRICEDYDASVWQGKCLSCNEVSYFRVNNEKECSICPNARIGKTKDGRIYCNPKKGN